MIPEDNDEAAMAGVMRPRQHKQHRKHESPFKYRKGEYLGVDPIGPFQVPSPAGYDCAMVYSDKSTSQIEVQGFKIGGKRSVKQLIREQKQTRELDDIRFTGIALDTHLMTTDYEEKMMSAEVAEMCAEDKIVHKMSPPRCTSSTSSKEGSRRSRPRLLRSTINQGSRSRSSCTR
jgi:hypothetical protein